MDKTIKTAEEILREYIDYDDETETIELLPLTIIDAMIEYATQFANDEYDVI